MRATAPLLPTPPSPTFSHRRKLRNRLKPRTTEQLTLAYHFLREDIKKLLKEMGPEAEYTLDLEDLERMDDSDLDDILAHADAAAGGVMGDGEEGDGAMHPDFFVSPKEAGMRKHYQEIDDVADA